MDSKHLSPFDVPGFLGLGAWPHQNNWKMEWKKMEINGMQFIVVVCNSNIFSTTCFQICARILIILIIPIFVDGTVLWGSKLICYPYRLIFYFLPFPTFSFGSVTICKDGISFITCNCLYGNIPIPFFDLDLKIGISFKGTSL